MTALPQPHPAATPSRPRSLFRVLLITLLTLLLLRLTTLLLPTDLLAPALRDTGTYAVGIFIESLPFVILGALISTAVQLWVPQWVFFKLLPRTPWLRRAALSLLGILFPVCECGNVPLARGLLRRGLSPSEAITFVLAAPLLNPVTIITTYQAFGFDNGILVARIVGGFVIANLAGFVFAQHPHPARTLQPDFAASCDSAHAGGGSTPNQSAPRWRAQVQQGAALCSSELLLLLPALTLGCLLAAVIQTGTPVTLLAALGSHPVYSVFALVLLAGIVSICSTVDAFFMLGFAGTFLPGGIVAFLVFGAMIDIKMLLLLRTTFTKRTLALLLALILSASLVLGFGVNLIV